MGDNNASIYSLDYRQEMSSGGLKVGDMHAGSQVGGTPDRQTTERRLSMTSSDDTIISADAALVHSEFEKESPRHNERNVMHPPHHLSQQQSSQQLSSQQQQQQQQQTSFSLTCDIDDDDDADDDEDDDDEEKQRSSTSDNGSNKHGQKYYHCRMCNKEFDSKSEMQQHSKEMHRTEEKGHKCFKCLKTFPSSQQLAQHALVHSNVRKYPCKFCDKTFKQLSHVQQHQRIHTGERPYRCSLEGCSKSFRQLSSLQQHLKGHSGLSSFKNYQVARSPTLAVPVNKNRDKQVSTSLARPHDFTCQVCEKICEDEIHFYRHIHQHHPDYWRVFSGGRPLADFIKDDSDLKQELDESTFYCQRCRMEFPNEFGYWKHLSLYHPPGDTPQPFAPDKFSSFLPQVTDPANPGRDLPLFACPICKKLFTKQSYLVRHIELKSDPDHRSALENLILKSNSLNASDQSPHNYDADVARMMTSLSRSNGGNDSPYKRAGFAFSGASLSSNEDQPIVVDDPEEKKEEQRRRLTPPEFYEPFLPYSKFTPRPTFNFFPTPSPVDQPRVFDDNYERAAALQQTFDEASDLMKGADYRKSLDYNNFYHHSNNYARPPFPGMLRLPPSSGTGSSRQPDNPIFGFDQRRLCRPLTDSPEHEKLIDMPNKRFMPFR